MDPLTIILILSGALLFIYQYLWKPMNHFKKLGVLHKRPVPILGNMTPIVFHRINISEHLQKMYNLYPNAKYFGIFNFNTPVIAIRDPDLIASITVKNFDQFCDHQGFVDEDLDPLMGRNLFSLKGDRWREMRRLLSPSFTGSKMKIMFNLMCDCADNFASFIAMESKQKKVYNLKEIFGRYTNDVVASCSFGHAVDSMRNPNNQFYAFARKTMKFTLSLSIKFLIGQNFPRLTKLLGVRMFNDKARKYFLDIITETVKLREEKGIYRPDMIQLMMESSEKGGKRVTIEEMTYQAFIFFFAGFDATSRFLCFVVHEIGIRPEVQARLQEEIEEVLRNNNGKPTYEALRDMKYLDAVLHETLRLYTVISFLDRVCVKEFELPPATPGSKPVTVKPGDILWYLPFSLHRDSTYYADPLDFRPERFLNGEVSQSVFMPFGMGPRICIGSRFAMMGCKIGLFYLLSRCELEPCAKTAIPMKFSKKIFVLLPEKGFWLSFKARKEQSAPCEENDNYGRNGVVSRG